ncbi:MAG: methyltransferase domain-containing protein [Candidatus Nanohaloarchaeota archaeon]|nr:methyltransferase domain-containing protein [Candidatus Nanohaloarchaeota archaeon]
MQEKGDSGSKVVLVYWLNLTNRELSIAEALSLAKMCDVNARIVKEENTKVYIAISKFKECDLAYRIAFNKKVGILLTKNNLYDLNNAVRVESDSLHLKKKAILRLMQQNVKLDPNSSIVVYVSAEHEYVLIKRIYKEAEFKERHPNARPGFMPFSLKPRIAQLLLNLAGVIPESKLLDPFAGVGGILIEGELFAHADGYGIELYNDVLWKAVKNKFHYNCRFKLIKGDATFLPFHHNSFDAIVSDLPYGRSSKQRKHFDELYDSFFKEAYEVVKPDKYVVVMVNDPHLNPSYFETMGKFGLYAHRSLTRYIYILKSKKQNKR